MTKDQAERLRESGISFPFLWSVLVDAPGVFAVKNALTGEIKVIKDELATVPVHELP